jgi:hypothetical protein
LQWAGRSVPRALLPERTVGRVSEAVAAVAAVGQASSTAAAAAARNHHHLSAEAAPAVGAPDYVPRGRRARAKAAQLEQGPDKEDDSWLRQIEREETSARRGEAEASAVRPPFERLGAPPPDHAVGVMQVPLLLLEYPLTYLPFDHAVGVMQMNVEHDESTVPGGGQRRGSGGRRHSCSGADVNAQAGVGVPLVVPEVRGTPNAHSHTMPH